MWQAEEKAGSYWSLKGQDCFGEDRAEPVFDREGNELRFFHLISAASSSKGVSGFLLNQRDEACEVSLGFSFRN
jgi:hypothetical protein